MEKKRNHSSLYPLIGVGVLVLFMNATLGFFLTKQSSNAMRDLIGNRMLDISNTAAAMLDGDVLESIQAEDLHTNEYREILKTLTYYQDNIDLKYIYCIRDTGDGNFVFTVDPTTDDPGEFGEPIVYTDALYKASLGIPSVDEEPYSDRWGRFYSSYSPVFDSKGQVAGIVAVDFSADWYDRQVRNQILIILVITALSLSFGLLVVFMIASKSRKRIHSLYNELNSLADGIEELAGELSEGKELKGTELLHTDSLSRGGADEVIALGDKIRSLQQYMKVQIDYARTKAYQDALTGLENRTSYLEYVKGTDERIGKKEMPSFAIAMFDINGLKDINDHQGHEYGDRVIAKAAGILRDAFPDERIFRIGGDEFVAIIPGPAGEEAKVFKDYDRLIATEGTAGEKVLLSKGYAPFDPASDGSFQDVFERADRSMYEAKKAYYGKTGDRRGRRS
ncbi:MAG: diguanylate cyclase [Lachnospiraceae bacterium]|nr:diguanylate cyclase [Lachnospiraceae bacterium]